MRTQSILPLKTVSGMLLGYVWLPQAHDLEEGSMVTVEGRDFQVSYTNYMSIVTSTRVEYAYIPIPATAVTTAGTCPWFSTAIYVSDEEPQLPWQQLGSCVNAPSRATPSVLQQFLNGRDFAPLYSSFDVDNVSDTIVSLCDYELFMKEGTVFRDVSLTTLAWPLVNSKFVDALTSITAVVSFEQRNMVGEPNKYSSDNPAFAVFALIDPEAPVIQAGLPNTLRVVRLPSVPVPEVTLMDITVTFTSQNSTNNVTISVFPA